MEGDSSRHNKRKWQDLNLETQSLPLHYLEKITNNFSDERLLGEGGFGCVYKGVLEDGSMLAVKKLRSMMPGIQDRQFENEAQFLMGLNHPNIVKLIGYCFETESILAEYNGKYVYADKSEKLLCLEYLPKGSLRSHLSDESSGLGWDTRYKIIEGICYGLHHLHEEWDVTPVIHMDLNPSNILLDDNMEPKIADFGLSRLFGEEQSRTCTINCKGTIGYMAPEYLHKGIVTKKVDIFSLGVIIIEIVTGHKDYPDKDETSSEEFIELVLKNWRNRLGKAPEYTTREIECEQISKCIQIGLECVKYNLKERPTTHQIIQMLHGEDAYALCRMFKKTAPGPKIIEHYGAVQHHVEQPERTTGSFGLSLGNAAWPGRCISAPGRRNRTPGNAAWARQLFQGSKQTGPTSSADHRSPTLDLSWDVRGDDFESSSFSFPTEAPTDSMHSGFGMQMRVLHEDGNWMQFQSEDAFNATNPFFINPLSSSFSRIPSKVDVALECARLQHRLSLPPLQVDDFPHDVNLDTKTRVLRSNPNEVDILQEFLSVASASQELINGSSSSYAGEMWPGAGTSNTSTHYINELSSLVELGVKAKVETDKFYHIGFAPESGHVNEPVRLVEISDMEVEFKEEKKQVENLSEIEQRPSGGKGKIKAHDQVVDKDTCRHCKKKGHLMKDCVDFLKWLNKKRDPLRGGP